MTKFVLGLDLGQSQDYTALTITERIPVLIVGGTGNRPAYAVRHLERFALGTPYPEVARRIWALCAAAPLKDDWTLAVDATGVGAAVVDLVRREISPSVYAVTITAGDTVSGERFNYRVPKRDLVGTIQVLLQSNRLKIARALPLAERLTGELLNFRVKITQEGHDTYAPWRESEHDDLVLSLAIGCWLAEHASPVRPAAARVPPRSTPGAFSRW